MFQPTGSSPQKQPPVEISNWRFENSFESGSSALNRIARGIQQGLFNKAFVLGLLLLVAESLLIAHFQPGVALTVLRDTPPLAVLTGTLANVTPLLVPIVGIGVCAFGILELPGAYTRDGLQQLTLGLVILVAALVFIDRTLVSLWLFLPLAAVAVLTIAFGLLAQAGRIDYDSIDSFRHTFKVFVVVLVGGFILSNPAVRDNLQRPYLPSEEIVIKEGTTEEPVVGYVLSTSGGNKWTTVLLEADRSIQIVETDSITNRAICSLDDDSSSRPWWNWFKTAPADNITRCDP